MVNEVTNRLMISGPADKVNDFIQSNLTDGDIDFNRSVPLADQTRYEAAMRWGISKCIDHSTRIIKVNGKDGIEFSTGSKPPIKWLETVNYLNPDLAFELVWFVMETHEYGSLKVHDDDYYELHHYKIQDDDIEYEFEEGFTEEEGYGPTYERAKGRFKAVLATVGLEYEAFCG